MSLIEHTIPTAIEPRLSEDPEAETVNQEDSKCQVLLTSEMDFTQERTDQ